MDQQDANLRNMLQLGIKAAQAKRKTEAYQLLSQVVRRDPRSEQGWLWLAAVAPHPQESLDAFNHVLAINPNNEQARVGQRWAMSRLSAASAPAATAAPQAAQAPLASPARPPAAPPPQAPSPRAGVSAESRATTFAPSGSTPGGNAPPAGGRAGLSSESLASLFAPQGALAGQPSAAPAATPAPVAPVASTAAPPASREAPARPEPVAPPAPPRPAPAPAWPESPVPQGGSPTAEIPVGSPAPAPAAPDDWRAAGDLNVPAGTVNWDDDGADLRNLDDLATDYAQGVTCPNCGAPGQTGLVCSLCNSPLPQPAPEGMDTLDPSLRGVGYAPQEARVATGANAPPLPRPVEYTAAPADEAPVSAYTETLRPVGRRPSVLPLVLGALLLLTGIVVAVYGLMGGNNTRFDQVGQRFFAAHLAKQYDSAANYLAPDLKASYLAAHDLPNLNLATTLAAAPAWTAQGAPLQMAPDGSSGESYVTLAPQGGGAPLRYLVKVTQSGGNWLIQSVLPQAP